MRKPRHKEVKDSSTTTQFLILSLFFTLGAQTLELHRATVCRCASVWKFGSQGTYYCENYLHFFLLNYTPRASFHIRTASHSIFLTVAKNSFVWLSMITAAPCGWTLAWLSLVLPETEIINQKYFFLSVLLCFLRKMASLIFFWHYCGLNFDDFILSICSPLYFVFLRACVRFHWCAF